MISFFFISCMFALLKDFSRVLVVQKGCVQFHFSAALPPQSPVVGADQSPVSVADQSSEAGGPPATGAVAEATALPVAPAGYPVWIGTGGTVTTASLAH